MHDKQTPLFFFQKYAYALPQGMCTNRCDCSVNGFQLNLMTADYLNSNTALRTRFNGRTFDSNGRCLRYQEFLPPKLINLFNNAVTLPLPNTMQLGIMSFFRMSP